MDAPRVAAEELALLRDADDSCPWPEKTFLASLEWYRLDALSKSVAKGYPKNTYVVECDCSFGSV